MNKSTWQQAKAIFDEARDMRGDDRKTFVDEVCAGDEDLRGEVEKLLGSYDSEFLEETALGAAEALVKPDLPPGQVIGRYQIGELIGTGGMGQVFRAEDTELKRPVAFKVLHRDVAGDEERVRRFIQEARAASALNHPNILTIHETGEFHGARFIVSEFVDGDTLRERMRSGMPVAQSIDITCQIATALEAAHSAGIVHRDIKPENVMIRRDGLVKVLDFGLAKLTEADDQPIDPTAPPSHVHTSPGLVMGTVAYMSPEQARGQAVDARSDLWSLGVVLHEMLTGRSPFEGETVTELITSILSTDSTPANADDVPPDLAPICKKALTRDKNKRYRSAHDLLNDLQGEKKRMEYAIQPSPFISAANNDDLKTQLIHRRPTLSSEYIVSTVKRHKFATLGIVGLIVSMGVGLSVYEYTGATTPERPGITHGIITEETSDKDLQLARIAASGNVIEATISPDGKFFGYVTGPKYRTSVHVKDLETQKDIEVVPPPPFKERATYLRLVFTPDSRRLLYRYDTPYNEEIFSVPVNGGTPTKIIEANGAALSPDGSTLAIHRDQWSAGRKDKDSKWLAYDIVLAKVDGTAQQTLLHTPGENDAAQCDPPVWAPDSKSLACWFSYTEDAQGRDRYFKVFTLSVADGSRQPMSDQKWKSISGVVWMPDNTLVVAGQTSATEKPQLWLVTKTSAKRITTDVNGYQSLAATRDGKTLVTVQPNVRNDLWIMPTIDSTRALPVTSSGELCGANAFSPFSRDKLLICSTSSGKPQIWMLGRSGNERQQLTFGEGQQAGPWATPDGRLIVYNSVRPDGIRICRMNADGTDQSELTTPGSAALIRVSPDGKWIYYYPRQREPNGRPVYKMSIDGGSPTLVGKTREWGAFDVSPRDERLAELLTNDVFQPIAINIYKSDGQLQKTIPLPLTAGTSNLRWTPDGQSVAFIDENNGTQNIWVVKADGKARPRPITNFTAPPVFGFRWSSDGKELLIGRQTATSDAIMITNPRD